MASRTGASRPKPLHVLDQLLVVLMLVEILHTVRISIRSHILVTEPFLIVGLIASLRRSLVITLEAATLTNKRRKALPFGLGI
ncbi:MAG TPA: phosphate-starvation-inducible PsiE family protein [Terriglobales bacterium]|nr:phosphate-starvation-inducible PsiE family protein [Terriglobales bacterium]